MSRMVFAGLSALCMTCSALGCGEEASSAGAPPGGGQLPRPVGGGGSRDDAGLEDAGRTDAATDAGGDAATDAGPDSDALFATFACEPIEQAIDMPLGAPEDFVPTHYFHGFLHGCAPAKVVVGLVDGACLVGDDCVRGSYGSDEVCFRGDSHMLILEVQAQALLDGRLRPGSNVLSAESETIDGMRVRYRRPSYVSPSGEWGSCSGADGLTIVNADGVASGELLSFGVDYTLTDCTGGMAAAQVVTGRVEATLQDGLRDVCPE